MTDRISGRCLWFTVKGYGFVEGENGIKYFVHYSRIKGEGFKHLHEGQRVTFTPGTSPKGPIAESVEASPF